MIYLLWLLPLLVGSICFLLYRNNDVFVMTGVSLFLVVAYTLIHEHVMEVALTEDTEWWGNYSVRVHDYDDWDEEVPCRHPEYCTRTVSYECGDGKTSRTCYTTETYVCGYEHPYDVDYHPEQWTMEFDDGRILSISAQQYWYWRNLWGNKAYKIDLHRDYHSNDGDDVAADYDKSPEHCRAWISEHNYENRIIGSHSVFRAAQVDTAEVRQYHLFEYPQCSNGSQVAVLGIPISDQEKRWVEYINGYYGSSKQFKLFVCCWRDQSEITAEKQHSYWGNLNKNEFLVCLGLDKSGAVKWCKTYSWMDRPALSTEVERYFSDRAEKRLQLLPFLQWLPDQIKQKWSRKHFRDFKYLQVDITASQYTTIFIVVVIMVLLQFLITNRILRA